MRWSYKKATGGERPGVYAPIFYQTSEEDKAYWEKVKSQTGMTITKPERDALLFQGVSIINKHYERYINYMTQNRAAFSTASDTLALGGTTAAAITTPPASAKILSSIAAVILGTKSSVEKNYYQEVSFFVLSAKMRAERSRKYNEILTNSKKSIDEYGLYEAMADLDAYYAAGTALNAMAQNLEASANEQMRASILKQVIDAKPKQ